MEGNNIEESQFEAIASAILVKPVVTDKVSTSSKNRM